MPEHQLRVRGALPAGRMQLAHQRHNADIRVVMIVIRAVFAAIGNIIVVSAGIHVQSDGDGGDRPGRSSAAAWE